MNSYHGLEHQNTTSICSSKKYDLNNRNQNFKQRIAGSRLMKLIWSFQSQNASQYEKLNTYTYIHTFQDIYAQQMIWRKTYFEAIDGEETTEDAFLETGAEYYHIVFFIHGGAIRLTNIKWNEKIEWFDFNQLKLSVNEEKEGRCLIGKDDDMGILD